MSYVVTFTIYRKGTPETAPDFWNLSHDVYPTTPGPSTDVMLIQGLLIAYFMSPRGPRVDLRTKGVALIASARGRFDDGYYGAKTREVLRLFEEDMKAPYKDGIVRNVNDYSVDLPPETKLKRLNFLWNMTMLGGAMGTTKKETGRRALHPTLFRELYPSG